MRKLCGGEGFLARLARDRRGNTLAIIAASVLPMAALAGSAVDVARMYVVKVRLQQACDAAALAGRKFMPTETITGEARRQAQIYFRNNFKDGWLGTTAVAFTPSQSTANVVDGAADATVPMTIMKMFGMADVTVHANCQAKLEIPNLDMMFVLDTTDSMRDTNPGDSDPRITVLRNSVMDFYDTLEAAKTGNTQIRYGFVPYATNVNVGFLLKREWLADSWNYQSRRFDRQTPGTPTTNTTTTTTEYKNVSGSITKHYTTLPAEQCVASPNSNTSSNGPKTTTKEQHGNEEWTITTWLRTTTGSVYSISYSNGTCTQTETRYNDYVERITQTTKPDGTTTTSAPTNYYIYDSLPFDVSKYKGSRSDGLMAGNTNATYQLGVPPGNTNPSSETKVAWAGCIEERQTVRTTDPATVPAGAKDLDIDLVPTDAATQWAPALPKLIYLRTSFSNWNYAAVNTNQGYQNVGDYNNGYYAACPSAARKLGVMNRGTVKSYMDGLTVSGNTYHDIGFLWGARLISPDGIFKSENQTAPNGGPISRHIIFMTDGATETAIANYEAYGISGLDRRRIGSKTSVPSNADQNKIVESRLAFLCEVAKQKQITVWVIAFGTAKTTLLENCASTGKSFEAKNATQLHAAFTSIAAKIAQLRITQ